MESIKNLKINYLRGITDLSLDLDGKSLLILGENGTGKSSIVDAIEFFFTGKISHLEKSQTTSTERHCPHVKFKSEDTKVGIIFNPGAINLERSFKSFYSIPENFEDYFKIAQQGTFILHRAQILEFIITKPAERFRTIGNIIGLDNLDNIELEMMRLKEDLTTKINQKDLTVSSQIKEISRILGKTDYNPDEVLPVLNEILKKYQQEPIKNINELSEKLEGMLKQTKNESDMKKSDSIRSSIALIEENLPLSEIRSSIEKSYNDLNKLLSENKLDILSKLDILNAGKYFLNEKKSITCPLCEQNIDPEEILESINIRLITINDLSENASNIRKSFEEKIQKIKELTSNISLLSNKLEGISELNDTKEVIKNDLLILKNILNILEKGKELKTSLNFKDIEILFLKLFDDLNQSLIILKSVLAKIGLSDKEKDFLKDLSIIEQVKTKTLDIIIIQKEIKNLKISLKLSESIYDSFSDSKKRKIKEIFDSIEKDIEAFYSKIHPNEFHNNIKLALASAKRASAEIKIDSFNRKEEDPRGLSSEGHLDSMGLCIFLAFVKNFNQKCSLIVLDDIVSTVDSQHRNKICKLLFEDFKDKQLIITTHDTNWYEQIRSHQRAYASEGNFINLTISDWSIDSGPKIKPYRPRWETIQDKILNNDKSSGNEGRQYLEWLLETICFITEAPVIFKISGKYEVSDLLEPAKKRLKELIYDNILNKEFQDLFRELESTIILGNLLSHNNELAGEISIKEIEKFCNDVHNIHNKILCPNCNKSIKYYRDLRILRCQSSNCKSPLEIKTK